MKEKSLNKVINDPIKDKDDEVLDDYSDVLTESHFQSAVRGKYARSLGDKDPSTIKIIAKNEERYVNMKTIEVAAFVNNEGQLTV
ncbi:MAG: hypothetical protein ACKPA9_13390, partial [Microcystis sp.]